MRWAFKVAYLGRRFHGSQRQPGRRTVEGDLLAALQAEGFLRDARGARFQTASRTDRGASALGNAVAFDADAHPRQIVASVNPRLEDAWLYAYAAVDSGFNARHARERWYRYHLRGDLPVESLRPLASLLQGEHDFRAFVKGPRPGRCHVTSVRLTEGDGWIALDIRADRFLRTMVRRIARALERAGEGTLGREDLQQALRGGRLDLEPAPAEFLWLMGVEYDVPFTAFDAPGLLEAVTGTAVAREMEGHFLRALRERLA